MVGLLSLCFWLLVVVHYFYYSAQVCLLQICVTLTGLISGMGSTKSNINFAVSTPVLSRYHRQELNDLPGVDWP